MEKETYKVAKARLLKEFKELDVKLLKTDFNEYYIAHRCGRNGVELVILERVISVRVWDDRSNAYFARTSIPLNERAKAKDLLKLYNKAVKAYDKLTNLFDY